jgi:hypothetical protein
MHPSDGTSAIASRIQGSCFGFAIRSSLDLRYLRGGGGDRLLIDESPVALPDLGRPLLDWRPPRNPFRAGLYVERGTYLLWVADAGWFRIDPERPAISVPTGGDPLRREERTWGIPILLCFLHRGDLPLHAAAVEIGGQAVLLAAPGRGGKTTLAAAFAAAGYRVLAEDLACIRMGDPVSVIPGPAMMRVRPDAAVHLTFGRGSRVERDDRVHVALDPATRGDCSPVPLRGVIFLREGDETHSTEPVGAGAAIPDLWTLNFHLPTDTDRARAFAGVADLASSVPVWNLVRPKRFDALARTVEAIVEHVSERVG